MSADAWTIPTRVWDEPDAPVVKPIIIVSSRDNAPVPHVGNAAKLAKVARERGWTVEMTYACAQWPDRPRKAAHRLASVAARLARGAERGYAVWTREDWPTGASGAWRFDSASLGGRLLSSREILADVSGRLAGDEPAPAGGSGGGAERLTGASPAPTPDGAP